MSFSWDKKRKIFEPTGQYDWMGLFAQNPNAILLEDRVRVFFNCRPAAPIDGNWTARIGWVDLDRSDLGRVLEIAQEPLIPPGELGTFDQFGTMSGCTVWHGDEIWNYYVGWTRCQAVPYNWAIGVARSQDGGKTFQKLGPGPVIGASVHEPFLQNAPFVMHCNGLWHCWYSSGIRWIQLSNKFESVYQIMHAVSKDGITWDRDSDPVIAPVVDEECQTSASIIFRNNKYHMWFSYRHGLDFRNVQRGYRIGYAWSDDLQTWHRDDRQAGIDVSEQGWDSEMICYPHVTKVDEKLVMFYCGNEFGKYGFGYAELN